MSQENTPEQRQSQVSSADGAVSGKRRPRSGGKGYRPTVGGTAAPGAKSTQPRQVSTSKDPRSQQAESYNRQMRRRMEHMGTGPSDTVNTAQRQRQKRLERKKLRVEQQRQEIRKTMPAGGIKLGRKTLYFFLGAVVLVVLLIVLFLLIRHPF